MSLSVLASRHGSLACLVLDSIHGQWQDRSSTTACLPALWRGAWRTFSGRCRHAYLSQSCAAKCGRTRLCTGASKLSSTSSMPDLTWRAHNPDRGKRLDLRFCLSAARLAGTGLPAYRRT
jgi:hypothetical protein